MVILFRLVLKRKVLADYVEIKDYILMWKYSPIVKIFVLPVGLWSIGVFMNSMYGMYGKGDEIDETSNFHNQVNFTQKFGNALFLACFQRPNPPQ
jgi:hypothetical protein